MLEDSSIDLDAAAAYSRLHRASNIYTAAALAARLLDAVGWTADEDLSLSVLLDPACGTGNLLLPATSRLLASLRRHGHEISTTSLTGRIRGFEVASPVAATTRSALAGLLMEAGVVSEEAHRVARAWIRTDDYLLKDTRIRFTHVVSNPPYARLCKLPSRLKTQYSVFFGPGADLSLLFLARAIEQSRPNARLAFLMPHRWPRTIQGIRARDWVLEHAELVSHERVPAAHAYEDLAGVDAGMSVLRVHAVPQSQNTAPALPVEARKRVHVGTAVGCKDVFVHRERPPIEECRILPFIDTQDLKNASDDPVDCCGWIINPWQADGRLVSLSEFPKMQAFLSAHRDRLASRYCARSAPETWYRTIDRIRALDVASPKILICGTGAKPLIACHKGGAVISNSLYWVQCKSITDARQLEIKLQEALGAIADDKMGKSDHWRFTTTPIIKALTESNVPASMEIAPNIRKKI